MNIVSYICRNFSRLMTIFPIMATVRGRENFPKDGGFILAANHISYFDPCIVGGNCPRLVHFLAKEELFKNRAFGWLLRKNYTHPLARGTGDLAGMKQAITLIKSGNGLVIFLEGTRSKTGELGEPKAGIGMIARRAGKPIIPCYSTGQNKLLSAIFGLRKMKVFYGKPLSPEWLAEQPAGKEGVIAIANEVMNRIKQLKIEADASR